MRAAQSPGRCPVPLLTFPFKALELLNRLKARTQLRASGGPAYTRSVITARSLGCRDTRRAEEGEEEEEVAGGSAGGNGRPYGSEGGAGLHSSAGSISPLFCHCCGGESVLALCMADESECCSCLVLRACSTMPPPSHSPSFVLQFYGSTRSPRQENMLDLQDLSLGMVGTMLCCAPPRAIWRASAGWARGLAGRRTQCYTICL
jgi:hypothetical protein